jgi:hypothetical protein
MRVIVSCNAEDDGRLGVAGCAAEERRARWNGTRVRVLVRLAVRRVWGEKAACPEGNPAWVAPVVVVCAVTATLGMAAAVWAYRESAGEPSGEWLLGAAGLYVTTLAWAATITGAVSLLFVDVCSL